MEREGNTAEQPIAPDLSTEPTDSSVAVDTTTETSSHQTTPEAAQTVQPAQVELANEQVSPQPRKNKKRIGIIAGIIAAALLVIGVITAIIINVSNNAETNTGSQETISNDDISLTDQGKEIGAQAEQLANDSNIKGMIEYIDNVIKAHNNGTNYQDLTQGDIGILCATGIEKIYDYISNDIDQMYAFAGVILSYAYTEESMVKTADSAADVYFAENLFGNTAVAEQYKKLAIERGSTIWEINGEKEE